MALFDFSFGTALLFTIVYVVFVVVGSFVPFINVLVGLLAIPLFFVLVGLWLLVLLSGFLSFALFWIIGLLLFLAYLEYNDKFVSRLISRLTKGGR